MSEDSSRPALGAPSLRLQRRLLGPWCVLTPKATRLDARRAPALRLALREALTTAPGVILDLRAVRSLDPSAAAVLLDAARGALGEGPCRLVVDGARVPSALEATGLLGLLEHFPELQLALDAPSPHLPGTSGTPGG